MNNPQGPTPAELLLELIADDLKSTENRTMGERNQYCVTVKVFTWAADEQEAVDNVIGDLDYVCEVDSQLSGFIHPSLRDVQLDTEA